MVYSPGNVVFLGETNAGVPVNFQFAPTNSHLNWIGKAPFPNGAISWFSFDIAYGREYFSSETGPFIFGSHSSTKVAFDEAWKSFNGVQPPG